MIIYICTKHGVVSCMDGWHGTSSKFSKCNVFQLSLDGASGICLVIVTEKKGHIHRLAEESIAIYSRNISKCKQ